MYENHHQNHGPPGVSAIKKVVEIAYKEEYFTFSRPKGNQERRNPMYRCPSCEKLVPLDRSKCDYCHEVFCGPMTVVVSKDYFD